MQLQHLRNHWYYWYTGQPLIAITSVILTAALLWGGMVWLENYSVWGILLAVALDTAGFWLALIYAVALRFYLPVIVVEQVDVIIIQHLLIPLVAAFVINRGVTWLMAKFLGNAKPWIRWMLWGLIALVISAAGWKGYDYYRTKQAELEASRAQIEQIKAKANAMAESATKAVNEAANTATQIANDTAASATKLANDAAVSAAKTADQLAIDTKAATLEACKKTANFLGKNPDDYCK